MLGLRVRGALAATSTLVMTVGMGGLETTQAWAATTQKSVSDHSSCTNKLMPGSQGTAELLLSGHGTAEKRAHSAKVASASVTASVLTCSSPSGMPESVSYLSVRGRYLVTFASPTSCEIQVGVPPSLKCTATPKTIILTFSKSCNGGSLCSASFDGSVSVIDSAGGAPISLVYEGYTSARQRGKDAVPVSDTADW